MPKPMPMRSMGDIDPTLLGPYQGVRKPIPDFNQPTLAQKSKLFRPPSAAANTIDPSRLDFDFGEITRSMGPPKEEDMLRKILGMLGLGAQ